MYDLHAGNVQLKCKISYFHSGAGLAHSHVHYLHPKGTASSATTSVCLTGLKLYKYNVMSKNLLDVEIMWQ